VTYAFGFFNAPSSELPDCKHTHSATNGVASFQVLKFHPGTQSIVAGMLTLQDIYCLLAVVFSVVLLVRLVPPSILKDSSGPFLQGTLTKHPTDVMAL
jgi:hypothetical protein